MERIKVTVVCDRCQQDTDLKPGSGVEVSFGGQRATVDLCVNCHAHLLEELAPLLDTGRRPGKVRADKPKTTCPDCGKSFTAGPGYTLHRIRMHSPEQTENRDGYAEAAG